MEEYGFIVLKPDCLRNNKHIAVLRELEKTDLKIIKMKFVKLIPPQIRVIYREKINQNYYPLLEKAMSSDFSLCIIVYGEDALQKSHDFKDKIRKEFGKTIKILKKDLDLLEKGVHPKQKEITTSNAIENLIHVADSAESVIESIIAIL